MMISGVTIVRNGLRLHYPFLEAIRSALPICDEYVVVVGDSQDETLDAIRSLKEPKIRIVETVWSDKVIPRKFILAQQTNIGIHLCRGDWVLYLQANEVLHEASLPVLYDVMKVHCDDSRVECLLLERLTFYGDFRHFVWVYPERFKYSPRVVRPYIGTYSIRDAMSFAVFDGFSTRGRYPKAMDTGENIFRYGFVRTSGQLSEKLHHAIQQPRTSGHPLPGEFFYQFQPKAFIKEYPGSQPGVMHEKISAFPQQISLSDERWRTKTTFNEKRRILETSFYHRFGIPGFRRTRYKLLGSYKKKERP